MCEAGEPNVKCSVCQTVNREGEKYCAKCGGSIQPAAATVESKPCSKCGMACKFDAKFCPSCGHDFFDPIADPGSSPVLQVTEDALEAKTVPVCPQCSAEVKADAKFCLKCGHGLIAAAAIDEPEVQSTHAPRCEKGQLEHLPDRAAAPSAELHDASVPPSVPSAISAMPGAKKWKSPRVLVMAGMLMAVVVMGMGAYLLYKQRPVTVPVATSAPATSAVPSSSPALPMPKVEAQEADPKPAAPSTTEVAKENSMPGTMPVQPVSKKPETKTAPVAAKSPVVAKSNGARPAEQSTPDTTMQSAIDGSLAEGARCMQAKRYDCAIANANAVLRLSPSHASALDMKRLAKEAQDKALSQIDIQ